MSNESSHPAECDSRKFGVNWQENKNFKPTQRPSVPMESAFWARKNYYNYKKEI